MASQISVIPQVLPSASNTLFHDKGWIVCKDGTIMYTSAHLKSIFTLNDLKGKTIRYFKSSAAFQPTPLRYTYAVAIDTAGGIYGLSVNETTKEIELVTAAENGANFDEYALIRGAVSGESTIHQVFFKDRVTGSIYTVALDTCVKTGSMTDDTIRLARFKVQGIIDGLKFDPITRGFYNKAGDIEVFAVNDAPTTISFSYQYANADYKDFGVARYNSVAYSVLSGKPYLSTGIQDSDGVSFNITNYAKGNMYSDGNSVFMLDMVKNRLGLLYLSDYQKQSTWLFKSSTPLQVLKDDVNHHIHVFATDSTKMPTLYSSIGFYGSATFPIYLRTLAADGITANTEDIAIDTVVSLRGNVTTRGFLLINSKTNRIFAGIINFTKKCWYLSEINPGGTAKIGDEQVPTATEFINNVKESYAWPYYNINSGEGINKYVLAANNEVFYSYDAAKGTFVRLSGPAQYTPGQGGTTGGGEAETSKQIICSSPAIVASLFGMRVIK